MIRIRGRAVTFGEIWYDEEAGNAPVDVIIHRQRPQPYPDRACTPFLSVVNDLTEAPETMLGAFGRTTRYEINRAQSKDGLHAASVSPTVEALLDFATFYDAFAQQKALAPVYRRGLWAAAAAQRLVLTQALRDDEILVRHAYIVAGARVVLLYSASHFRKMEKAERALVSRANRWLHWQDMAAFRAQGFERYDWGGLFEDEGTPERAGINGFKCDFGGSRETTYNCTYGVSPKGRLYLAMRRTVERFTRSA